jgi:hypothetical protein
MEVINSYCLHDNSKRNMIHPEKIPEWNISKALCCDDTQLFCWNHHLNAGNYCLRNPPDVKDFFWFSISILYYKTSLCYTKKKPTQGRPNRERESADGWTLGPFDATSSGPYFVSLFRFGGRWGDKKSKVAAAGASIKSCLVTRESEMK